MSRADIYNQMQRLINDLRTNEKLYFTKGNIIAHLDIWLNQLKAIDDQEFEQMCDETEGM